MDFNPPKGRTMSVMPLALRYAIGAILVSLALPFILIGCVVDEVWERMK